MNSLLTLILLLLSCLCLTLACDPACTSTGERNGRCYYNCYEGVCHMSAAHHQDQFLRGLRGKGYACNAEGNTVVVCNKSGNFGDCYGHYWGCGSSC
ncbi:uncharacterized protein BX664DRAFT_358185 [Halteromyces radiatus]|uniref:uncharacterized protein n=1 Tax=Halteromyces radiatus TaxID=101107 RepID=UPI00221EB768|nr:uncharacterized protein BX664DRAFT_358185 [Halteromyces radiatus]KAI8093795.1 hypothetical protein BX664DRAFT_358185 [Halteromyces radiatus]